MNNDLKEKANELKSMTEKMNEMNKILQDGITKTEFKRILTGISIESPDLDYIKNDITKREKNND